MQSYGGQLIYYERDEEGELEVVDAFGERSLHFGTSPKQSALELNEPGRLKLAYVRAMLAALLFTPAPTRALVIGLGGGSLARFLLESYPQCQIEAVERRAAVARIAHEYFGLPRDPRLLLHINDGFAFLSQAAQRGEAQAYDLILVDAYDHLGMDQSINAEDFFAYCLRLLRSGGALSMNLWGTHAVSLRRSLNLFQQFFPERALRLAVPNRGNVIGLGLGQDAESFSLKQLAAKAKALESQHGIEASYFLRGLQKL
jgi:spermidine synthase